VIWLLRREQKGNGKVQVIKEGKPHKMQAMLNARHAVMGTCRSIGHSHHCRHKQQQQQQQQ